MRSFVRILFLLNLFFLSGCAKHPDILFELSAIDLSNCNDISAKPFDAGTDSVPKNAYAIKLTETMQLASTPPKFPDESRYVNVDELNSFNIYSLTNFDGTHPANSSLNDYFLGGLNSSATIASAVASKQIGTGRSYEPDVLQTWQDSFFLYLMTPPALPGNYSFVVDVGMSDNRHLIDTVFVKLY